MTDETEPTATESPTSTAADPTATATEEKEKGEEQAKKPAKLTQSVEFRDVGPCKKHIKVTVERRDIDVRIEEKFTELAVESTVPVPGFRPGKAPRKIIERRFHKDVADQVKAEVLLASLEQLTTEHDISPLTTPNIDPAKLEIPKEGPFIYEFEVEVRPQFELPDYKGLKLKRPVRQITDADVAKEERRLLEPYGQVMPKPAAPGGSEPVVDIGDYLVADLSTRDGDRVLGEIKEMRFRVEPRVAFKDGVASKFGEQVKGAKVGEVRTVDISFTDRVADQSLKGRIIQARLDIKDIKIVQLPEITHELMHEFGVHNIEQFRELLRVVLEKRLEYQQRQSAREQVMSLISAASSWDLPRDMLMREARTALGRRVMEMRSSGIADDEIAARQRTLERDSLQSTALALKEHFVLQKIADVEKLEVTDDDINDEIERLAEQHDEPPRRLRAQLEREGMMDALAADLIERKALDLVLSTAQYEDVPMTTPEDESPAAVDQQAISGEMKDPTIEAPKAEATPEAPKS